MKHAITLLLFAATLLAGCGGSTDTSSGPCAAGQHLVEGHYEQRSTYDSHGNEFYYQQFVPDYCANNAPY